MIEYFDWFKLDINCSLKDLEVAYRTKLKQVHPDLRGSNELFIKTKIARKNIENFLDKKKQAYKTIKKDDIKDKIECRCGEFYLIDSEDVLVECDCCSCFVVIE